MDVGNRPEHHWAAPISDVPPEPALRLPVERGDLLENPLQRRMRDVHLPERHGLERKRQRGDFEDGLRLAGTRIRALSAVHPVGAVVFTGHRHPLHPLGHPALF